MRIFLESGHGLFFMGLAFVLGLLMKGAVSFRYQRLTAGAESLGDCKQKQLKKLKTRFENTYRTGGDVPCLEAFVDSSLHQIRTLGFRAARLSSMGGQALALSVCLGLCLAAASWFYQVGRNWVLAYGGAALGLLMLGGFYTGFLNLKEKQSYLRAVLLDQLGNVWKARLDGKEKKEERREQEISYLKQSLDRIAASKEENFREKPEEPCFSDREQETFEEILKEYFS